MMYVSPCLGISGTSKADAFEIYPNPSNGRFIIACSASCNVSIFDAFGKLVLTQQLIAGDNDIDLGTLANGIYFVKSGGIDQRAARIIKQ
jgi:hypothetical protein